MNTFASVSMLETDKPIRKASPDLDPHIEMYKLYLTSSLLPITTVRKAFPLVTYYAIIVLKYVLSVRTLL